MDSGGKSKTKIEKAFHYFAWFPLDTYFVKKKKLDQSHLKRFEFFSSFQNMNLWVSEKP